MTRRRRIAAVAAVVVVASALLSACSSDTPETVPTSPVPGTAVPTSPGPTPVAEETTAPTTDPTCETIIPPDTVASLESEGWSPRLDVFRIGALELSDGIQCTWGDHTVATDHVQIYGWAPITETQTQQAAAELTDSGWRREDGEGGFYVTESAESVFAPDDEGYGFTYFFGDGWVSLADTKQTLVLVEWPPA